MSRPLDPTNKRHAAKRGQLKRGSPVQNVTLRTFCATCNNGWMSRIVERAKPAVRRLIEGDWSLPSLGDRKAIATWAALKTMVVEQADPTTAAVPVQQITSLRETEQVPEGWLVAVAPYTGSRVQASFYHRAMAYDHPKLRHLPRERHLSQTTARAFGSVLVVTMSAFDAETLRMLVPETSLYAKDLGLRVIWPDYVDPGVMLRPPLDDDAGGLSAIINYTTGAIDMTGPADGIIGLITRK